MRWYSDRDNRIVETSVDQRQLQNRRKTMVGTTDPGPRNNFNIVSAPITDQWTTNRCDLQCSTRFNLNTIFKS